MKNRLVLSILSATLLLGVAPAFADKPFNPDCHLEGINRDLDSVIAQIKSSPALGFAGGHYGQAIADLNKTRNQLHDGCRVWNESLHKK